MVDVAVVDLIAEARLACARPILYAANVLNPRRMSAKATPNTCLKTSKHQLVH